MNFLLLLGCLFLASPAFSQTPRYTNADLGQPVSSVKGTPAEAAAILAPHQFTLTPAAAADGPRVLILESSVTAGPFGEFREFSPARRLDGTYLSDPVWISSPYLPVFGGWGGSPTRRSHVDGGPRHGTRSEPRAPAGPAPSAARGPYNRR
jgi:hypothetical protein